MRRRLLLFLLPLMACGPKPPAPAPDCPQELGHVVASEGQAHVPEGTSVSYLANPPASGPHWPTPSPWGVFADPVPRERWVHNLEHGGIVLLYNCSSGCPEVVDAYQRLAQNTPKDDTGQVRILVTPDSAIATRMAAVAWLRVLEGDKLAEDQLRCFVSLYTGHAPENF